MPMKRHRALSRLAGLFLCLFAGIASAALGVSGLAEVRSSYEPEDILYDEGPELFRQWLGRGYREGSLNAQSVSGRILVMPIGARRALVTAMMKPDFVSALADQEADRRILQELMEDGLLKALETAPTAGGLWLAASKIRSQSTGFDRRAEDYLAASYLTAPREGDIARLRVLYVSDVGALLRDSMETERERDWATAREIDPAFDKKFQAWLGAGAGRGTHERRN